MHRHRRKRIAIDHAGSAPEVRLTVLEGRDELCNYPARLDCVRELTAVEVKRFAEYFLASPAADYVDERPNIRSMEFGDKVIFAVYGIPSNVSSALRYGLRVPASALNRVCLFIIGACWKES